VVLDNLNTHSLAAFYEAFPLEQALLLTRKADSQRTIQTLSGQISSFSMW